MIVNEFICIPHNRLKARKSYTIARDRVKTTKGKQYPLVQIYLFVDLFYNLIGFASRYLFHDR